MLGLKIRAVCADDTYEIVITPRLAVMFERHFKMSLTKALAEERRVEHLYWLAWEGIRASGVVVKPFDTWLDSVTSAEYVFDGADDPKG